MTTEEEKKKAEKTEEAKKELRFNLMHLVSDWFRNPVFRDQFSRAEYAKRIEILRNDYKLDDSELRAVINHDEPLVRLNLADAMIHADTKRPPDFKGSLTARMQSEPIRPGQEKNVPGWPGGQWCCIEEVRPATSKAGPILLELRGWNLTDKHSFFLQGTSRIELKGKFQSFKDGSCRYSCDSIDLSEGEWGLVVRLGTDDTPFAGLAVAVRVSAAAPPRPDAAP